MTRTVVIGGGIAGLTAARSAAIAGDEVTVLEGSAAWGGSVADVRLGELAVDIGAESFASRGTAVANLALALGLETAPPTDGGAWLDFGDRAAPIPAGVLGIPVSPLASDVREAIGTGAATRAWLDRVTPDLHIGRHRNLGSLVRSRMGETVLDSLVRPVVQGVYGVDPDDADVDVLLPGLNGALTRAGSLSGAVASLRAAAPAGAAVTGIRGGVHQLVPALLEALHRLDVRLAPSSAVDGIVRSDAGWEVSAAGQRIEADRVILATSGEAARSLLRAAVADDLLEGWPAARESVAYALLIDAPELDTAPRGTGVLVVQPSAGEPSALTHSTAKWPWLRDSLPPGRHVLRLTYPGRATPSLADAVRDAGRLLGVPLDEASVVAHGGRLWTQDPSRAQLGVRERIEALALALSDVDGLAVTGSWFAGTGLAATIPHAQAAGIAPSER